MIRKWMTVFLTLLLAFTLPLNALADKQHTLTIVPGELLASEQAVADLLNVLDLRLTEGDDSGALTVLLNDQELVTVGLTADITGLYAGSQVLGPDVLYVTWDDAFAVLTDLMTASMAQAGVGTDEVQMLEGSMAEAKTAIVTAIGSGNAGLVQTAAPATWEESLKLVEELYPDDPQMVAYIKSIYEGITIEDGSFEDSERDAADQKYSLVMDKADLMGVFDTAYMRSLVLESLSMQVTDATQEEMAQLADEVIAESKALIEAGEFEMVMELYTVDGGQVPVGMRLAANMSMYDGEAQETAQLAALYNRLTDAAGVSHKANGAFAADDESVSFLFDLYRANSEKSTGMLGLLADGEEFVITYKAENTAADTRVRNAELYTRSGATAILPPAASDRPVIGVVITTEPAPEETLAALENATPENSVNVLKLSEAEMEALANTVMTNGMQLFYTALSQLPTSVMTLLMSE